MDSPDHTSVVTVALVGNPNTGKSTLFGALVGVHQRVGNYPGVTVERKTGRFAGARRNYDVVDLPGLYSLAPRSRDEMVVVDVLLGRMAEVPPIDVIVCVIDASNLRRNLYVVSQVFELGLPVVVALNKFDVAENLGAPVDFDRLCQRLPVPVVRTQANRAQGIEELKRVMDGIELGATAEREPVFPKAFENEVAELAPLVEEICRCHGRSVSSRWLARRLLLDGAGHLQAALLCGRGWRRRHGQSRGGGALGGPVAGRGRGRFGCEALQTRLAAARARLAEQGYPLPDIEPEARYDWAQRILDGVVGTPAEYRTTSSDRLDRVLTHPVWGTSVFALIMFVVFQAVFSWAIPLMNLIGTMVDDLGRAVASGLAGTDLAGGAIESLLIHGVIGGVGSVLSFLPQILILFFFIALLEQCGYMARAAYLMDNLMSRVGLNGKSFIPLLCSFACAVPAIMATRVISNERSRLTTILVAPLMTCSARLPVYTLLIAAFVPSWTCFGGLVNLQGLVLVSLYLLGVVTAIVVALLLRRTLLRGAAQPLLMEMPPYEWPSPRVVLMRVVERGWLFLRAAGTVILAVSILVWASLYYPRPAQIADSFGPRRVALRSSLERSGPDTAEHDRIEAELVRLDRDVEAAYQRQSLLARLGHAIEPAVRPLGWDWRIGSAVLASFPQREAVVATLGVVFSHDDEQTGQTSEDHAGLSARLRKATWEGTDRPLFNLPVALSIMVFYALCAQCVATLVVTGRETNSWRWPLFTFAYLTTLAYVGALITYQLGMWIAGG
ncbi:MAG: ferrous iron transporter B [Pirellulales bacterium]|nr:ferrous iron transporter B [Pirellulales bacterium]